MHGPATRAATLRGPARAQGGRFRPLRPPAFAFLPPTPPFPDSFLPSSRPRRAPREEGGDRSRGRTPDSVGQGGLKVAEDIPESAVQALYGPGSP